MIYEIYGIRLDPCKMLYQSTLFIVNAVIFALDRMLSDQPGWIIGDACICAMASMTSTHRVGADWVFHMRQSILILLTALSSSPTLR